MPLATAHIRVARTAELDDASLRQARALLNAAFGDAMTELDWQHALGGVHALAYDDGNLVGHAAVVARELTCDGRALRTGYVEGVAVHPAHRRRGHATAAMEALERVIRGEFELGALGATDDAVPFYAGHGWLRWRGPTTPDAEGCLFVLPVATGIDITGELACDRRDGDLW